MDYKYGLGQLKLLGKNHLQLRAHKLVIPFLHIFRLSEKQSTFGGVKIDFFANIWLSVIITSSLLGPIFIKTICASLIKFPRLPIRSSNHITASPTVKILGVMHC